MRERKYIKLRSDMYDDTKFKIIDTMENRDTINYIWTRILTLCGKINNNFGYLLVCKNIIYTIDLLAIEFNRTKEQVEDAINVFIDLKMMSKDENGMLRVCNWGKHQGNYKQNTEEKKIKVLNTEKEDKFEEKHEEKEYKNVEKLNLVTVKNIEEEKDKENQNLNKVSKVVETKDNINNSIKDCINDNISDEEKTIVDINDISKEICANKVKQKKNKKKGKGKIEEIECVDTEWTEDNTCGFVGDAKDMDFGKVIKSFDLS